MAKLPCPPDLWPAFSSLLDQALDLPESERVAWLATLGAEHAEVVPWLSKVITDSVTTAAPNFMNGPMLDEPTPEFQAGQQVGPYRITQRLGSGGMGEVWLASRSDGTLNRQVALKLPHIHLMAAVLRRRFERERDILAGLSHPHIAQLYDAGVADSQHPYLAMEWVDGTGISEHCRNAKLSLQRRLDLFLQILDAVGYAHARLIAHRDLKPSNILVTRDERVKLLDFGIAKLLVGDTENGATQLTRLGGCMATPAYAAPEQLAGKPITASVDLYALGVILHELLTAHRPVRDPRSTAGEHAESLARASSKVEPHHAQFVGGLDARQLRRALTGDLDAIIAKALEVDPVHRYRSAEAFAQDIELSRKHRPISARHISAATVGLKFIRRHGLGVAMAIGLVLALLGGSAGIAWQAVRAEREAQRATTIKDFLVGVFRASDPRIAADKPRGEITARELLDVSTAQIESGFAKQPATEIELLGVTADIYRELDETQRSTSLYERETGLAAKYLGSDDVHAIDGLLGQAYNADADGDDARALILLNRANPLIHQAHLDTTATRARWLLMHGEAMMSDAAKSSDAQAALEAAAALFASASPNDPRYPDALQDLGTMALERSEFAKSATYYRRAIAAADSVRHLEGDLLLPYMGLALTLEDLGDFIGAADAFEHGTNIAARTYGRISHNYWMIASDWAQFRYERGAREESLAAFETLTRSLPGEAAEFRNATDTLEAAQVLRKYGTCLALDGQGARSIRLLERAQALLKVSAPHAVDAWRMQLDLARAYEAGGRLANSRDAFRAALRILYAQNEAALQIASAHERWGRYLLGRGDTIGAELEFDETLRLSAGHFNESAVYAQAGKAAIAVARGDAQTALRASALAMQQLNHVEGKFDIRIEPYVWGIRAQSLLLGGDAAAGLALANRTRNATLLYFDPGSAQVAAADALAQRLTAGTTTR